MPKYPHESLKWVRFCCFFLSRSQKREIFRKSLWVCEKDLGDKNGETTVPWQVSALKINLKGSLSDLWDKVFRASFLHGFLRLEDEGDRWLSQEMHHWCILDRWLGQNDLAWCSCFCISADVNKFRWSWSRSDTGQSQTFVPFYLWERNCFYIPTTKTEFCVIKRDAPFAGRMSHIDHRSAHTLCLGFLSPCFFLGWSRRHSI